MKTSVFVLKTSFSDLRKNLNLKNLNMIISRLVHISVFLKFGKKCIYNSSNSSLL